MLAGTIKKGKEVIIIKVRAVVALGEGRRLWLGGEPIEFLSVNNILFPDLVRFHGSPLYNWLSCTLIFYAFLYVSYISQ